jgi:hypothetical protein
MTRHQNTALWGLRLAIVLILSSVFAWYFLGPVPFDLEQLWALCAQN